VDSLSGPRQNRVTPRGDLVAVAARGGLMGNRGRLHDPAGRIVRRQVAGYRAWVTCLLDFKGRRRPIMVPGRYTELFFLDEATALAAGHRPCGECRRSDFLRFKAAWLAANPGSRGAGPTSIADIDREMHRDRLTADGRQRTFAMEPAVLPDGAFVARGTGGPPLLIWAGSLRPWTPEGYGKAEARPAAGAVTVLTPASTVRALAAGYTPGVHPSAGEVSR
jgi:hypothetical protein